MSDPKDSGFAVVYVLNGRFVPITKPRNARGLKPEAVWLFGEPFNRDDQELFHCVAPALTWVPHERIHRIQRVAPKPPPAPPAASHNSTGVGA